MHTRYYYATTFLGLLGILVFGIHLTGYVRTEDGGYKMWIARRSLSKATYPGMLDNMVRSLLFNFIS